MSQMAQTTAGKLSTIAGSWEIASGRAGKAVLEFLKPVLDGILKTMEWLGEGGVAAVSGVATAIAGLAGAFAAARAASVLLGVSMRTALVSTGIGAALVAVGLLTSYIIGNWDKVVAYTKYLAGRVKLFFRQMYTFGAAQTSKARANLETSLKKELDSINKKHEKQKQIEKKSAAKSLAVTRSTEKAKTQIVKKESDKRKQN